MGIKVFSSARNIGAITPSDSATLNCKAIYVGTTGDVAIKTGSGATAVTFVGVPAGSYLLVELRDGLVMSTNTTASDLVFLDW